MAAAKPRPSKPGGPEPALGPDQLEAAGAVARDRAEHIERADSPVDRAVLGAGRAQALSMAMVDAAGHLRRVETLSLAAMATALEAILSGDTERGAATLEAAEASLDRAMGRLVSLVDRSTGHEGA